MRITGIIVTLLTLSFSFAIGQENIFQSASAFDSLLSKKPVIVLYNFSQPVKYNPAVRILLDSLEKKNSENFFLVVKGLSVRELRSFLSNELFFDVTKVPILVNDSIFLSLSHYEQSGTAVFNSQRDKFQFDSFLSLSVSQILSNIGDLTPIHLTGIDSIELRDDVYHTGFGNMFYSVGNSYLLLFNRQSNQLLKYSLTNGGLLDKFKFNYDYDSLYTKVFGSNPIQLSYANDHRNIFQKDKLPINECNILSIAMCENHLCFAVLLYFIRFEGKDIHGEDSVGLVPQNFIVKSESETNLDNLSYYAIQSDDVLPNGYISWLYQGFYLKGNSLLLQVLKPEESIQPNDTLRILATYKLQDETFKFSKIEHYKLPVFFLEQKLFYSQSNGLFFNWRDSLYYQFLIYPHAINLSHGLSFTIQDSCYLFADHSSLINSSLKNHLYSILSVAPFKNDQYLGYVYQCNDQFKFMFLSATFRKEQDIVLSRFSNLYDQEFSMGDNRILLLKIGAKKTMLYQFKFE